MIKAAPFFCVKLYREAVISVGGKAGSKLQTSLMTYMYLIRIQTYGLCEFQDYTEDP